MVKDLDYADIKFPISKKYCCKIEQKNSICVNVSCYENDLVYPVHIPDKKFEDCVIRQKIRIKKHFCRYCLLCFEKLVLKKSLMELKKFLFEDKKW